MQGWRFFSYFFVRILFIFSFGFARGELDVFSWGGGDSHIPSIGGGVHTWRGCGEEEQGSALVFELAGREEYGLLSLDVNSRWGAWLGLARRCAFVQN